MIKPRGRRIGLIRLSAIGDVCHAVATVQALQRHAPEDDITWIIGRTEAALVSDLPGITFIVFGEEYVFTFPIRGFYFVSCLFTETRICGD